MNFEYFIAKRITFQSKRSFSKLIVRLAIAAISLSLAIMLISVAVVKGFQGEITNKVIGFGSHVQITKSRFSKSFEQEPIQKDSSLEVEVGGIPGVRHVQPFATKPGIMKTDEAIEGVVLKGVTGDFDWTFISRMMVKGGKLHLSDTSASDHIVVSRDIANRLKLDTGSEVVVYFVQYPTRVRKFKVRGIFETGLEEVDKYFVISDLRHIRKLNNWKDNEIGGYEVLLSDLEALPGINHEIRKRISVYQDTHTIQQLFPQIFDWLGLLNINVQIILVLMAIVASINMITALLIMILERTQLVGLLKALGASNGSVRTVFVYNAMFLIGMGILIGDVLGIGLLYVQDQFGLIKLAQESYYVNEVPVHFRWDMFLFINAGTFLFCSIMMLLPALMVTRILPVRALRFE